MKDAEKLGSLTDDFIYPLGGRTIGNNQLVLFFAKPLPVEARLSYAAARNAQYGPHRRWGLEFGGLQDGSGHQTPAFVLVPIGRPKGTSREFLLEVSGPTDIAKEWKQIAVNCVGRYPDAVISPKAVAGTKLGDWRQTYWNPVAAGVSPNLFDRLGRVTGVSFESGVWYMSPYFRKLKNADDALMASWCKHNLHSFTGLKQKAKYDLAIYLLQGPPKKSKVAQNHRPVRVSLLRIPKGKQRRDAKTVTHQTVQVPAQGKFEGYQVATEGNKFHGNVVILQGVVADNQGLIDFAVEVNERRGDRIRWGDATLAGVQIRSKDGK